MTTKEKVQFDPQDEIGFKETGFAMTFGMFPDDFYA